MRKILLLLHMCFVVATNDIIYIRVPNIISAVSDFFEQEQLYECFKKQVDNKLLYLKCLKNDTIIDVVISIHDNTMKTAYI